MNLALIVSAARGLFVDDGYVATRIERIAERVGVSKPTAFASVGNKRALLKRLETWPWPVTTSRSRLRHAPGFRKRSPNQTPGSRCGYMLET